MKKGLFLIALVVIAVAVYFLLFFNKHKDEATTEKKQKPVPLAISKNPDAFNTAFGEMLSSYYDLKDALVNWDSTKAAKDAASLAALTDKVPFNLVKADSNVVTTAKSFSGAVATESGNIAKAKTIDAQRRSFNTISDNLYSLINTVRYDREVIYHDMCPMAFGEDEQAFWLSRDSAISNPYLGNKLGKYKGAMVTCGEVEDSVNFVSK